jgi:hypothetical protein
VTTRRTVALVAAGILLFCIGILVMFLVTPEQTTVTVPTTVERNVTVTLPGETVVEEFPVTETASETVTETVTENGCVVGNG